MERWVQTTRRSSVYGTAVGADYRVSPNTLAGFALAGGGTSFGVANALGSGRSDLFQAGAFVRHNVGAAYLSGALAYGWQDITTNRTLTIVGIDQLRAQFNANAMVGQGRGRLSLRRRRASAGRRMPRASSRPSTCRPMPNRSSSGANTFALAYGAKSVTAMRSELGLRTDKSFATDDGVLTLRGRAAWAHDYNADRNVSATFQTLPGASFVVNGARPASDCRAGNGICREEVAEWLVGRRHLPERNHPIKKPPGFAGRFLFFSNAGVIRRCQSAVTTSRLCAARQLRCSRSARTRQVPVPRPARARCGLPQARDRQVRCSRS